MKTGRTVLNIFKNGCVLFTIITFFTYGVGTILSTAEKTFIPTFQWILLFFIFSLLLSSASQVMHLEKVSLPVRFLLHFFAAAALYIIVVVLCGGFYKNGTMLLLSILLFIVGYSVFAVAYMIGCRRRSYSSKKNEAYKSVFH